MVLVLLWLCFVGLDVLLLDVFGVDVGKGLGKLWLVKKLAGSGC